MPIHNHHFDLHRLAALFFTGLPEEVVAAILDSKSAQETTMEKVKQVAETYAQEIDKACNYLRVFGMSDKVPLDEVYIRVNILLFEIPRAPKYPESLRYSR
ncbi:MAG: hypothetical protein AAF798_05935 [Bacteroidota bacterium]